MPEEINLIYVAAFAPDEGERPLDVENTGEIRTARQPVAGGML
jgi:hypothetical protein